MKRLVFAIAILCVVSTAASATGTPVYLDKTGGVFGWNSSFNVTYDGQSTPVGGGGRFTVDVYDNDPNDPNNPGTIQYQHLMFCVDVGTYISGAPWSATRYLVPPDPESPPPYSTQDAVELFYMYENKSAAGVAGEGWRTSTTTAAAVQLALWEITHETNWRTEFDKTNWYDTGDFKTNFSNTTIRGAAGDMLFALNGLEGYSSVNRGYFYRVDPEFTSQGLLGEAPPIPEPSTLILLGLGLTAAGVGVIRRRPKA